MIISPVKLLIIININYFFPGNVAAFPVFFTLFFFLYRKHFGSITTILHEQEFSFSYYFLLFVYIACFFFYYQI